MRAPGPALHSPRTARPSRRTRAPSPRRRAPQAGRKPLCPGAAVALSFNANTLPLTDAREMLATAGFEPLTGGPYDGLSHWVEQAITRDVAVARFPG